MLNDKERKWVEDNYGLIDLVVAKFAKTYDERITVWENAAEALCKIAPMCVENSIDSNEILLNCLGIYVIQEMLKNADISKMEIDIPGDSLLKIVDEYNAIGCTSFQMSEEDMNAAVERLDMDEE